MDTRLFRFLDLLNLKVNSGSSESSSEYRSVSRLDFEGVIVGREKTVRIGTGLVECTDLRSSLCSFDKEDINKSDCSTAAAGCRCGQALQVSSSLASAELLSSQTIHVREQLKGMNILSSVLTPHCTKSITIDDKSKVAIQRNSKNPWPG